MKKILCIAIAVAAALALGSCTKEGTAISNTLNLDGKAYKVDFRGGFDEQIFDMDIHFIDESSLANDWGMMWASGKVGTFSLPAPQADFMLSRNNMDPIFAFKSGTVKSWIEEGCLCLVVDAITSEGNSLKLSVKSE